MTAIPCKLQAGHVLVVPAEDDQEVPGADLPQVDALCNSCQDIQAIRCCGQTGDRPRTHDFLLELILTLQLPGADVVLALLRRQQVLAIE